MAKIILPGTVINGYTIKRQINKGAMAIAYEAVSSTGEKVFLKQYKSPSVRTEWYKGYVAYQSELKRRIENARRAKNYCYRILDFFEAEWGSACYFQVFEFVDKGHDLQHILEQIRAKPSSYAFDDRLTLAKVMIAGIDALHEAKIVHCDLKPENIQLYRDSTIRTGYQLKIIDMDFSILSDQRAPWHGHQGYVGTPGYFSPEHLQEGKTPTDASDVFTCGLILHELLASGHPYRFDDDGQYVDAVLAHHATPPRLAGSTPHERAIADTLWRCLSPDPSRRPPAKEVSDALKGKLAPPAARKKTADTTPRRTVTPVTPSNKASVTTLTLVDEHGKSIACKGKTPVGGRLVRQFDTKDAVYWDSVQFTVESTDSGWVVVPNRNAANDTLLNGIKIVDPTPLKDGDQVAAGRESKGISKLPLTIRLS